MEALKKAGVRTVNFEDEGEGSALADLVINAVYDAPQSTPDRLYGPEWFCLRDEFVNATRNVFRKEVKTVLITFGGTDQRNFTRRIFELIEPVCREKGIAIRIVAGPGYMHRYEMERRVQEAQEANPLISFTWATNVMSRMMEGADLCICSAGRTTYELAHMRVPAMVLATHEREATHSFARPKYGFVFLGLMDKVTDKKILRAFCAMLGARQRQRFHERMAALDFTCNKAKVIRRILDLLPDGPDGSGAVQPSAVVAGPAHQAAE